MTKPADLIGFLFDGHSHLLSGEMRRWMESSPRFTDFVETYRDKIRKKVRLNPTPESTLDLRSELEVAYSLLNDRRLAVAYEPYASAKKRGPDFAVTYRANLAFNLEVARLRAKETGTDAAHAIPARERVLRVLLYKLGQLQPGMPNLLVIHTQANLAQTIDLAHLMQEFKLLVDDKTSPFYTAGRYSSPAAFYKEFQRLSGIFFWSAGGSWWGNKQARPVLPEDVARLLRSLPPGSDLGS